MSGVADIVAELDVVEVDTLDRAGVQSALSQLARVRGWHDGLHVRLSRRLQHLAQDSPSMFAPADIAAASGTSQRVANQAAKRADTLDAVPALENTLAAGECSAEHIDALGRALQRLQPTQREQLAAGGERLAAIAKRTSPEEFDKALKAEIGRLDPGEADDRLAKQRRAARFRWWTDRDTGMVCFRGELDPETGLKVISRIDTTVEGLFHKRVPDDCPQGEGKQDFLRAQAFTRLILRRSKASTTERAGTGTSPAGSDCDDDGDGEADISVVDNRCEMMVVIDLGTLIHGLHARSILDNGYDIDLPLESYRRMACQAAIIPVVLDSNGVCVDEGRQVRLATRAQRRALRAMYDTCPIPTCTVRWRHCQPHHIHWSEHLGPTDLNNLVPLCSRHHHAVHEGGWHLAIHPDRSLTITYPDGTIHNTGPPHRKQAAA